jgi:nuclear cap-binding protein subunit 1
MNLNMSQQVNYSTYNTHTALTILPGNSHYAAAESLQKKMRERPPPSLADISVFVNTMRTELISTGLSDSRAASRTRSITMQCLLVLGSRSFSHFLNAIERYLQILHTLSNTPDAKFEMLEIVSTFWRRNRQMILIVFDKLMQYQVVDPSDVVSWAFEGGGLGEKGDGLSTFQWELMKIALDKSNGRVSIAQRRVVNQRKLDEEAMAKAKAKEAGNEKMDVDDITAVADGDFPLPFPPFYCSNPRSVPTEESADMQKQTRAHQILVAEQKSVLSRAVDGFVTVLGSTDDHITEEAWNSRSSWTRAQWDAIETWGWFRHFTRNVSNLKWYNTGDLRLLQQYAPHLRVYKESLSAAYLSRVPAERPSGALMREIWSIAVEQDS